MRERIQSIHCLSRKGEKALRRRERVALRRRGKKAVQDSMA